MERKITIKRCTMFRQERIAEKSSNNSDTQRRNATLGYNFTIAVILIFRIE